MKRWSGLWELFEQSDFLYVPERAGPADPDAPDPARPISVFEPLG